MAALADMLYGVIDPYLLAVPPEDCTRERMTSFARAILDWRNALAANRVGLCIPKRALQVLGKVGAYPGFALVQDRLVAREISEIATRDLMTIVDWFLARTQCLEDALGIVEVVVRGNGFPVDDPRLLDRLEPPVRALLAHSLLVCAVYRSTHSHSQDVVFLLSTDAPEGHAPRVHVRCFIERCVWRKPSSDATPSHVGVVDEQLPAAFAPDSVLDYFSISDIWGSIPLAVKWGYRRAVPQYEQSDWPLQDFAVNSAFVDTFKGHSLTEADLSSIFQTIALLVSRKGVSMGGLQLHPLREGGHSGPQIRRAQDGAGAMRMQLEQHGRGLQVHYWDLGGGRVELAALRAHHDMSIPQ